MDRKEREKLQVMIVRNLGNQEAQLKKLVDAKNIYRAKVAELNTQGAKMYSQEFLESEIKRHKAAYRGVMDTIRAGILNDLKELRYLLNERDQSLDLDNPALSTALSIIQAAGRNLPLQEKQRIHENFKHDQAALQALKAVYRGQGIETASLDQMIYNANEYIDNLTAVANQSLSYDGEFDGSINRYSSRLAVLADLEGATVSKTPDDIGVIEAFRRGAALSLQEEG